MKKSILLLFLLPLLSCFDLFKKQERQSLPELNGSWTLIYNGYLGQSYLTYPNIFSTGTSLITDGTSSNGANSILYSANQGLSWNMVFDSIANPPGYFTYIDLMNSSRLVNYSPVNNTLYLSINGGQSWSVWNHPAVGPDSANQMILVGFSNNRLFALQGSFPTPNYGLVTATSAYLVESDDMGNSWNTVSANNVIAANVVSLRGQISTSIAVTAIYNKLFIQLNPGVLYSNDNGSTWTVGNTSNANVIYSGATTLGYVLGINASGNTIYKSSDTGQTWALLAPIPTPNGSLSSNFVSSLAFDSVLLICGNYYSNYSVICTDPVKGGLFACDKGLSGSTGSLLCDNQYVYMLSSGVTGYNIYRRPRADFVGL